MRDAAPVCRILRHSAVDGPGNRAVLFTQGCNYDCLYCHNPETLNLCDGCGVCAGACPRGALRAGGETALWEERLCVRCDACLRACPRHSDPRAVPLTPEEAFGRVARDIPFIRGVTVSGGECTLYPAFLRGFFALCRRRGLTTFIDTNGSCDFARDEALLALTDGVMPDIKAGDPETHRRVTGVRHDPLPGVLFLAGRGKLYEVRTVVSPGLPDARPAVERACRALAPVAPGLRYRLTACRPGGVRPLYRDRLPTPGAAEMEELARLVAGYGLLPVVT